MTDFPIPFDDDDLFASAGLRLTVDLTGADEKRPGVQEALVATLDLLRGLGVANLLSDDSARRDALLAGWKRQLSKILKTSEEK